MYRIPVYRIQLVRDSSRAVSEKRISQPNVAADILRQYLAGADRENFVVLMLDTKNHVIGIHTVSTGTPNVCIVHPREVFKPAILSNACGIVAGHNHPSGDPAPSAEDRAIARNLAEAGKILGITLLDFLIITDTDRYFSFIETGNM